MAKGRRGRAGAGGSSPEREREWQSHSERHTEGGEAGGVRPGPEVRRKRGPLRKWWSRT